ncbi:phage head completion protein [Sandarakinorhabdus sp. DWP1-3-1]|uniref:phage head completion protein n=1 Tax=Sandarakinorhabdus sp. DWP1-3-1 TaxID=2804627 RepID=UPI003CEBC3FE
MVDELAGALNQRVAIETWVAARDDAGADAGHWQARGPAYAAVVPDGGGGVAGEARRSLRRWQVTLRAPAVVSLTSRLIWNGRYLAVLAIETDPRLPDRVRLRCEGRDA